jgi:general secretion pathway protein L
MLVQRSDPKKLIQRFWNWWSGEILQVVPPKFRALFDRQERVLIISAEENDLRARLLPAPESQEPQATDPEVLWPEADIAVVELSPLQAFRRRVSLPFGTEDRLADVLGYEMDRLTPYVQEDVYFDFRIASRDSQRRVVNIDLVVALRRTVDGILERLRGLDIEPSKITLRGGVAGDEQMPVNLLPESKQSRSMSQREIVPVAITVCAALLAVIALAYPVAHKLLRLQDLDAEIGRLTPAALAAQETQEEIAAAVRQGGFFAEKWASMPTTIQLLNEVTRVVPDDTWLSQVQIKGDTVRIQGESEGASSLIGLMEASELFRDVSFSSTVTKNPRTSNDRFVIQATIETPTSNGEIQ